MTILELSEVTLPVATPGEGVEAAELRGLGSLVVQRAFQLSYAVEPGVLLALSGEPESRQRLMERLRWTGFEALPELVVLGISDGEARDPVGKSDLLHVPVDFVFEEDFRPAAFSH